MGTSVDEGSGTESQIEEPGLSGTSGSDWTPEEQNNLDQALLLYPVNQYPRAFERTILVSALMPTRSAREVALRINWLSSKCGQKPQELKRRGGLPTSTLTRISSLQSPSPNKSLSSQPFSRTIAPNHGSVGQQPQSSTIAPTLASDQHNFPQLMLPPPLNSPLLPSLSLSCLFQSSSPPTNSNSSDDACVNVGVMFTTAGLSASDSASAKSAAPSPPGTAQQPVVASVQSLINQVRRSHFAAQ
jgi:hypothetical protein